MKPITSSFNTYLQLNEGYTICTCWEIKLSDGTVKYYTDHDSDVIYLGNTYLNSGGMSRTSVQSSKSVKNVNVTIQGFIDPNDISLGFITDGGLDNSEVSIFLLNFNDVSMGSIPIFNGVVGGIDFNSLEFSMTTEGLSSKFSKSTTKYITNYCSVSQFGNAECGIVPTTANGSILSLANEYTINTSATNMIVNDYENGILKFTSGANTGKSYVVTSNTANSLLLRLKPFSPVSTGDTFTLTQGCNKTITTCKDKYNNIINNRSFPTVPTPDIIGKITITKSPVQTQA